MELFQLMMISERNFVCRYPYDALAANQYSDGSESA